MAETARTKISEKSFDVFEFKEEDEQTEFPVKKFTTKFGYRRAMDHVSGTEIQLKVNNTVICEGVDDADIDANHVAAGSFTPIKTEDFAKDKMPELNKFLNNDFKIHEQAAEIKSNILESDFVRVECGPSPGATPWLENHLNCASPESSFNDESVRLASDADDSMSERSASTIADNNASCDGSPSDNCFSNWDMGGSMIGTDFYPDYIDYRGTRYLDSVVSFSRSFIEAKGNTIRNERTLHIRLEIEDMVRIESQYLARYNTGTISIYFMSQDVPQDDVVYNASGIQELKFLAVDSYWYTKQEAIESLDVRYKALWSVLLDTGMENSSAFPEGKAMMFPRRYFPNFDTPFEEVIYPKGDPDAVSIIKRDVDLLQPDTFVNDTIIDFYIKYLKTRQNIEERTRFHFFNCFFFRKLADMDKDPSNAFDGKAAFHRVRKWTRKINLLEKDFIFIPVNYNSHWSVIVICYFGEVARSKGVEDDNSVRMPCILHMDSLRGNHEGLIDLIQSYLWEEWKERQKETCEDLYSKFRNLKFVTLELPQQQNTSDCGLFLLHYVELFLEEVPPNFSIHKISSSTKFLQPDWFPPAEASMKRGHIMRLINGLLDTQSEDCPPPSDSNNLTTTHDYENGADFSGRSCPSRDSHEHSLCQVGQGDEIFQCTKTSGLVLKELFDQGPASESFNDAPWGALDCRPSLPLIEEEEEVEANECYIPTEIAEPVFPYSSGDFTLEAVHQPTLEDSPLSSQFQVDDHEQQSESSDEQHSAKRMRIIAPPEYNGEEEGLISNLSKDSLHL